MKKVSQKIVAALAVMAVSATVAEATPAFARQMGSDCMVCHYQNIPKLNKFGRDFKLSGFTMTGTPTIDGKANGGTSLTTVLNMGFVTKARLHKKDSVNMLTEIFDESAILFGGKVNENIGTSMEFGAGLLGGKFVFSQEALGGRIGLTYFTTDALGAFSGLEAYSTGLYRPIRQFENRKKANIFQALSIGAGEATGGQVYYSGNGILATVGAYMPTFGASAESGFTGYKMLARAAYEMDLAGHEVSLGGYYLGGDMSAVNYNTTNKAVIDTNAASRTSYGLDMQTQGNVADMPLMVTAGWVISDIYGTNGANDEGGFSVAAQVNPIEVLGVKGAVMAHNDNKTTANSTMNYTVGTDYNVGANVRLCLEYTYTQKATTGEHDILFMSMIAF